MDRSVSDKMTALHARALDTAPVKVSPGNYCRYIGLCRWGTACGYMTPAEAWAKIMPVAQLLQNTFSSWTDLGKNYLIGRKFWQPVNINERNFEDNYKKLVSDPKSPWNTLPWKMSLSAPKN